MGEKSIPQAGHHANKKPLYGIGINDSTVTVNRMNDGKLIRCPLYARWKDMLRRCYCPEFHKNHPTYIGCKVAEEWHQFSNFRNWMEKQNWQGMYLDKDFLTDSKVYGPDTCVFIPQWLNTIFNRDRGREHNIAKPRRIGNWIGYRARLRTTDGDIYLGMFPTPEAAHAAYVTAKTDYVRSRYPEIALIDPRLVEACERKLSQLFSPRQCGDDKRAYEQLDNQIHVKSPTKVRK